MIDEFCKKFKSLLSQKLKFFLAILLVSIICNTTVPKKKKKIKMYNQNPIFKPLTFLLSYKC